LNSSRSTSTIDETFAEPAVKHSRDRFRKVFQLVSPTCPMFSSLRVTSCAVRSSWRPSASRAFSATSLRHARRETDASEEEEIGTTYKVFMEKIGVQYEKVNGMNNWLHPKRVSWSAPWVIYIFIVQHFLFPVSQPFPMNQSFMPPPPISDALRENIWEEFMQDPRTNNLRTLSERYGLSLKRVDAILRLKGLESAWKEVSPNLSYTSSAASQCHDDLKTISLEDIFMVNSTYNILNNIHSWLEFNL